MLGLGVKLHGKGADRRSAIRQKRQRLRVLYTLGLQHRAQSLFGFGIVGLDKAKALGRLYGRHGFADNDLKVALFLLPVPDIPAVEPNGEGSLGGRPWPFVSRA